MSVFYSPYSDIILATLSILLMWAGITCLAISREHDPVQPVPAWRYLGAAMLLLAAREWIGVFSLSESEFTTNQSLASIVQLAAGILVLIAAHKESPPGGKTARLVEGLLAVFLLVLMALVLMPLLSYGGRFREEQAAISVPLFFVVKFSLSLVALLLLYCACISAEPPPRSLRLLLAAFFLHALVVALCRPPGIPPVPEALGKTSESAMPLLFLLRVFLVLAMATLAWNIYSRALGAVAAARWWPFFIMLTTIAAGLLFVVVSSRSYATVVRKNMITTAGNAAAAIAPDTLLMAARKPGAANAPDAAATIFGRARQTQSFQGYSRLAVQVDALAAPPEHKHVSPIIDVVYHGGGGQWATRLRPLDRAWNRLREDGLFIDESGAEALLPVIVMAPVIGKDGAAGAAVLSVSSTSLIRDMYVFRRPLLLLIPLAMLAALLLLTGLQRSWLAAHSTSHAAALRLGTLSNDLAGIMVIEGNGPDAVIVDANQRYADIVGMRLDDIVGRSAETAFDIPDADSLAKARAFRDAPGEEVPSAIEMPLRRPDGRLVHLLVYGRSLSAAPGERNFVWQVIDITRFKEMEREIRAAHDRLQLILDTIPEAIFVKDGRGRYVLANRAFHRLLRMAEGESVIGRRLSELHPRESEMDEANDQICRDMRGETLSYAQDLRFGADDAHFYEIAKTLRRLGDNDADDVIVGRVHDLTPRKRIEEAIESERHFLRQLIDSLPIYVCFVDNDRIIRICDGDFCREAGFRNPDELVGRPFDDVTPFGPPDREEDETLLACGEGFRDANIEVADGERIRHFIVRRSVLSSRDGRVLGLVKSFWDTTPLVAANQAARKAERAKAAFLVNMSHELRTPMNGIVGMADLIIDHQATEPLQRLHAETILRSAKTLQMVIDEVLDVATLEDGGNRFAPHPAPFPLLGLAEEAAQVVSCIVEAWEVELSLQYDFSLQTVYNGDARHLRQILVQILTHCSRMTNDRRLRLEIANVGGFEDERVAFRVIFQPAEGLGSAQIEEMFKNPRNASDETRSAISLGIFNDRIGLPLTWRLIEILGGSLAVSDQFKDIRCEVVLPLNSRDYGPQPLAAPDLNGARILVGTDSRERARSMADCLEYARAEVCLADTAEALRMRLRAARDEDRPFELIVLDSGLAAGEDLAGFVAEVNGYYGDPAGANIILVVTSRQVQNFALPPKAVKCLLLPPICPSELWYKAEMLLGGLTQEPARFRHRSTRIARLMKIPANVLLVEDNPVNQMVAMGILKRIGCRTTLAGDGREAVDLIVRRKMEFDIVFMDCMMPEMDGYEATSRIRLHERAEGRERAFIIALTANSLAGDREKCLASGMDDYMTKPVTLERIRDCLLKYCPALATMVDQAEDAAG